MKHPKRFLLMVLAALALVLFGQFVPAHATTQAAPTECQTLWLQGEGFTAECFAEQEIEGLVEIVHLDSAESPNPWAAFVRFHAKGEDGIVRMVSQSPLTTSRLGRMNPSQGRLSQHQVGVGKRDHNGFALRRVRRLTLENGNYYHNPRVAVALHGPVGDGRDNPTGYSGGLEGYQPPENPNGRGSLLCFRVVRAYRYMRDQIMSTQQRGDVDWIIRHAN